ncbi:MAG: hypothetical protein WCE21_02990 [Candidatus Babeliales bacterium]
MKLRLSIALLVAAPLISAMEQDTEKVACKGYSNLSYFVGIPGQRTVGGENTISLFPIHVDLKYRKPFQHKEWIEIYTKSFASLIDITVRNTQTNHREILFDCPATMKVTDGDPVCITFLSENILHNDFTRYLMEHKYHTLLSSRSLYSDVVLDKSASVIYNKSSKKAVVKDITLEFKNIKTKATAMHRIRELELSDK